MSLRVDRVQLEIILRADKARTEIISLEDEAKQLTKEMKNLQQGTAEYTAKAQRMAEIKARIAQLRNEIGITGMTLKELTARQRELNLQMRNLDPRTPEYARLRGELDQVNARYRELRGNAANTENQFSRLANGFNKYFGILTAGIAAVTGLSFTFRRLAEDVAKMDDVYADVRKYTGDTAEEIAALNEEFKRMDTRTGREELNRLAAEAGKIGVKGKKDLLDFAAGANIIKVALGEDLGEDAIKQIGKLTKMFGDADRMGLKQSMLSVGSAINEVAQNSTASEPYLVNFTNRMAGIGKQAGMTIPQLIGFGSVLDQNAQAVELSSTALDKFIVQMINHTADVAKAAGVPLDELNKKLREDTNGALLMVFEALNKKGGLTDLAPLFKDLGAEGARSAKIISVLADKYPAIVKEQQLANKAFDEGTSVVNEYNVKNSTLAAQLDKAKKQMKEAALDLGQRLNPVLLKSTNIFTYLIKALPVVIKFFAEYGGIILKTAIVIGTYTAAVKLQALWEAKAATALSLKNIALKATAIATTLAKAATYLYVAALALLTGNIDRATKAFRIFSNTIKANPLALLLSLLTAIGVAIYTIVKESGKLTKAQQAFRDFQIELQKETTAANSLFEALKKTNEGTQERKDLIQKINERYGEYLTNQLNEKSGLWEIEQAQLSVNAALEKNIALKTRDAKKAEIVNKSIEEQVEKLDDIRRLIAKKIGDDTAEIFVKQFKSIADDGNKEKSEALKQVADLMKKYGIAENYAESNMMRIIGLSNTYIKNVRTAKKDLNDIDKKFARILGSDTVDMPDPTGQENRKDPDPYKSATGKNAKKQLTDDELKTLKQAYEAELKLKEDILNKDKALFLKERADNITSDKEYKDKLLARENLFLLEKLKLQKDSAQPTGETEREIQQARLDEVSKALTDMEDRHRAYQAELAEQRAINMLDEDAYQQAQLAAEQKLLENKLAHYRKYKIEAYDLEKQVAENSLKQYDTLLNVAQKAWDKEKLALSKRRIDGKVSDQRFKELQIEQELDFLKAKLLLKKQFGMQTTATDQQIADIILAQVEAIRSAAEAIDLSEYNELIKQQANYRQQLNDQYLNEKRDKELALLDSMRTDGLLREHEYTQELLRIWAEYLSAKIQIAQEYINMAGGLEQAFSDAQNARLERDKEKELTAAGNNEEKRKQIEEKYAKEKIEIDKRQADVKFAITAAQIIASTAMAIMTGFAQLGPIGGAVAAAMLTTTGALQLAAANAEREKVKNMSYYGSGGESAVTGRRVVNSSTGTGFYDGGHTGKGGRYEVAGIVHKGEYVVPYLEMQKPEVFNHVQAIENIRRQRTGKNPLPASGFYDGGHTGGGGLPPRPSADDTIFIEIRDFLANLNANGVTTVFSISKFDETQAKLRQSISRGSRGDSAKNKPAVTGGGKNTTITQTITQKPQWGEF